MLRRLPVSRDQVMLLLMAVNLIFLGVDTFLAHSLSGTIRTYEWIPILFGPVAGALLLAAGLIAMRRRSAATVLACGVFTLSFLVGVLGTYFHLRRVLIGIAPVGETLPLLVWAPPALGPLAFCLMGWVGISAVWPEDPVDSGRLNLLGGRTLQLPYSKTQAYYFLVGLGLLMSLISSTLDHARTGFSNPWLVVPLAAGVFGAVVPIVTGLIDRPSRSDLITYSATMAMMILVGVVGAFLHVRADLSGGPASQVIPERFLRGAPFLAPLLYANFGMLGLIALMGEKEKKPKEGEQ